MGPDLTDKLDMSFKAILRIISGGQSEEGDKVLLRATSQEFTPGEAAGVEAIASFDAILVRMEVTGPTQAFWEKQDEAFSQILAEHTSFAKSMITRYGGHLYLQVGSEIIFYFRDTSPQIAALAVSCVRSIFDQAQQIEQRISKGSQGFFKLKSSLTQGKLKIYTHGNERILNGLPLIESAKLLSTFDDKAKNLLCFFEKSHHGFSYLCDAESFKEAVLKNFKEPMTVAKAINMKSIQSFVARKNLQALTYFRSDRDLLLVMDQFSKNLSSANEEELASVLRCYKSMSIAAASLPLIEAAEKLKDLAKQRYQDQWIQEKTFLAVENFVQKLIPSSHSEQESKVIDFSEKRAA